MNQAIFPINTDILVLEVAVEYMSCHSSLNESEPYKYP